MADAEAFAASPRHRAAVRDLYAQRWQYSHFSAVWELASSHGRQVFCPDCDAVTPARARVCRGCGAALVDPHRDATTWRPGDDSRRPAEST